MGSDLISNRAAPGAALNRGDAATYIFGEVKRLMDELDSSASQISCLRCKQQLQHVGTRRFHEGTNWGALGEIGELFVKRERFDVYICNRCGHVEFFVDGLGEQYRPA